MKPEITCLDDEFYVLWKEQGVGITFAKLRETETGQVRGHVTAEAVPPATPSGHISWTIMALDAATARDRLAKEIGRVCPGPDWGPQVNRACQEVAMRFSAPRPVVDLAEVGVCLSSEYLIRPLLPLNQITLFYADQEGSKSYLMALLAVCVALGIRVPFLSSGPQLIGPVIYWDWETDEQAQRRRFEYVCRGLGVEFPKGMLFYQPMSGRLVERASDMRREIARLHPALIVTDSLTFATGMNLNATDASGPTMNAIGGLGPVTKAVSAHFKKASREEQTPASVLGSGLFEFKARALWEMRREHLGRSFNVGLFCRKMSDDVRAGDVGYGMTFDNEAATVTFSQSMVEDTPDLERYKAPRDRLVKLLLAAAPLTVEEASDRTGLAAATIKKEFNGAPHIFTNLNRSVGGRGKAGLWAVRTQTEPFRENRSPIDKSIEERFGPSDQPNRSQQNRSEPFRPNGLTDQEAEIQYPFEAEGD